MPINFILTNAGKAAIVAANNTGTNPVTINRVGVGSASWTPTAAATALNTEIKKISAIGGAAVANDTIHVTASDTSSDEYIVKEIGLFLTDGTTWQSTRRAPRSSRRAPIPLRSSPLTWSSLGFRLEA